MAIADSSLHEAIIRGEEKTAREIILSGEVRINQKIKSGSILNRGFTPLMLAVSKGFKDLAILLLSKGADPDAVNWHYCSAKDMAGFRDDDMIKIF